MFRNVSEFWLFHTVYISINEGLGDDKKRGQKTCCLLCVLLKCSQKMFLLSILQSNQIFHMTVITCNSIFAKTLQKVLSVPFCAEKLS